jgi:hypothetical protein
MHVFSRAVRNRRRPQSVTWVNDNEVIIDGKKTDIRVFRDFLHFQIQSLEDFLIEKVLFGSDLEKLGITIDFRKLGDHGDFTTIGYKPLLVSLEGNPDSEKFLEALVKKGEVVSFKGGKLVWEMEQAQLWVANINQAVQNTYAIAHITQGAPGRTTEEDKMQIANTPATRRHLIVPPNLNTLAIWSNYWKGAKISGRFKEILRVFPRVVANFIFILIRVIRPIEILFLAKHLTLASDRIKMTTAYDSSLWASLGAPMHATTMRASLAHFFALPGKDGNPISGLNDGFPLNVRFYRQLTATIQRRHLPGSPKYTQQIANSQTSAGDMQAGRTEATSHQNYAVEKSTIDMEPGFTAHYLAYSKAWHKFWGLETEGEPEGKMALKGVSQGINDHQ